jgi:adenylyl cyclase-associated protein
MEFQSGPNKWLVENQSAANGLVRIEIGDKKETVYLYGCVGASIEVIGKCKSIIVDSCSKTSVHFDAVMASCEVVNSQRIQIHCREMVAAVAIDKTDGIVVHLPRSSLNTEVVASKSSEMNISWPDENGDVIERPIPEQYVHRVVNNAITANVSDLYTH